MLSKALTLCSSGDNDTVCRARPYCDEAEPGFEQHASTEAGCQQVLLLPDSIDGNSPKLRRF